MEERACFIRKNWEWTWELTRGIGVVVFRLGGFIVFGEFESEMVHEAGEAEADIGEV